MPDAFIKAGEQMAELGAMEPCQTGWQGSHWPSEMGEFADGRAAMMLGFEDTQPRQTPQATDGVGLAEDNIGRFVFPVGRRRRGRSRRSPSAA